MRGVSRSSRTCGGMRWTRRPCKTNVAGRGRRSRVVLAPRCWRQALRNYFREVTVARKPGHRGELEVSRKPPRRESRIASAGPVCSCALSFAQIAHETAGAARTRLSLRPLHFRGRNETQSSDIICREIADVHPHVTVMPATGSSCRRARQAPVGHPVRRGPSAQP